MNLFPLINPMNSFKDAAATFSSIPDTVYIEMEHVPLAFYKGFKDISLLKT